MSASLAALQCAFGGTTIVGSKSVTRELRRLSNLFYCLPGKAANVHQHKNNTACYWPLGGRLGRAFLPTRIAAAAFTFW